jgi:hypothetical protein
MRSFWLAGLLCAMMLTNFACKDKDQAPTTPSPAPAADTATFTPTGTLPTATPTTSVGASTTATATPTRTNTFPIGFTYTYTSTPTRTNTFTSTSTHTRTLTPTSTPTPTITNTGACGAAPFTCTHTHTPTSTNTQTITPFPTPLCGATAETLGETNSYSTGYSNWYSASPLRLYMTRYMLDLPATVYSLSAYVSHMSAGASIRLALYSSDGGGNPLIFLGGTNNTGTVMGWNKLALTSERYLDAGTYWIAANMQTSAGATFCVCEWGIGNYWIVDYPNPTPQVFPNPASQATPYSAPYGPSLYMEYCPAPTYTVTSTPIPRCTVEVSPTITPVNHPNGYEPDYCQATPVGWNPPLGLGYFPVVTPSAPVDRQKVLTGWMGSNDDDYFTFIARATGTYTFHLDCFDDGGATHEVNLMLFPESCPPGGMIVTTTGQTGTLRTMTASLTVNNTYYLVVRNVSTVTGAYRVVMISP